MPLSRCDCAGMRLLLGLALVVTTLLSLSPQPAPLPDISNADKVAHLLTYALLAFLVDASWPKRRFAWREWLALLAYGVMIELVQSQIPGRFMSLGDIAANATGIGIYALLIGPFLRLNSSCPSER
jgi:VanZ family protein